MTCLLSEQKGIVKQMKTKSERREEKRRKRIRGKLMRGNRWVFLRKLLSENKYHVANTMEKGGSDERT